MAWERPANRVLDPRRGGGTPPPAKARLGAPGIAPPSIDMSPPDADHLAAVVAPLAADFGRLGRLRVDRRGRGRRGPPRPCGVRRSPDRARPAGLGHLVGAGASGIAVRRPQMRLRVRPPDCQRARRHRPRPRMQSRRALHAGRFFRGVGRQGGGRSRPRGRRRRGRAATPGANPCRMPRVGLVDRPSGGRGGRRPRAASPASLHPGGGPLGLFPPLIRICAEAPRLESARPRRADRTGAGGLDGSDRGIAVMKMTQEAARSCITRRFEAK